MSLRALGLFWLKLSGLAQDVHLRSVSKLPRSNRAEKHAVVSELDARIILVRLIGAIRLRFIHNNSRVVQLLRLCVIKLRLCVIQLLGVIQLRLGVIILD